MLRATLKSIAAHKRRLLSTATAVVLGVAFLSGTLVLGNTMRSGFADVFKEANAGTDAIVRSATEVGEADVTERGLLPEATVDQVRAVEGVAVAEPTIQGAAQVVGSDGDPIGGNGPPTFGAGWISDPGLNPWEVAEGRAPEADGEVVIDRATAEGGDLAVGDTVTIRTPEPVEEQLVGIVTFGDAEGMGGPTYAAFTPSYAQRLLLERPGEISGVVATGDGSVSEGELARRISDALPGDTETLTAAALTAEQEDDIQADFIGFFETILLMFAGIALVVATFSIYNTFSILVAQRTRESALFRALGASRRQVVTSVVIEAVAVGVVASAVGLAAGVGLAMGLLALAQSAWGMLSVPVVVGASPVITGVVVGVLVTVVASVAPALRASRVAPLAALRDVAVDRSGSSRWRALFGVLATVAGAVLVVAGSSGHSVPQAGLGAVTILAGFVLLGPIAARPVAATLGFPLARLRGMSGKLARQNAMRNPRRTASTASALMVGVAVVTLFTVMGASIKTSVDDTVDEQFVGDLVIARQDFSGSGITPELGEDIKALDEVDTAVTFATAPLELDGRGMAPTATDLGTVVEVLDLGPREGDLASVGAGEIALGDEWARDKGYAVGDTIPATFADGTTENLTLAATYHETALLGEVIVPTEVWVPHAGQLSDDVIAIDLADGVTDAEGQAAIQPLVDRHGAPEVMDRDEYVAAVAGEVDQMLIIVYVLLVLAVIIALMGIANTLSLSIHERARELGLLRAVGQTRRQVRAMVRGESFLVALFGTVGGVALGAFLGWALIRSLADEGFEAVTIPTGQLAVVLALGAVIGVVAAVRPARRAAKLDVLAAIASD
jgi:putative ABC transport system permease protein